MPVKEEEDADSILFVEKPISPQLVKTSPASYGTRNFIIAFATARRLYLL